MVKTVELIKRSQITTIAKSNELAVLSRYSNAGVANLSLMKIHQKEFKYLAIDLPVTKLTR